MRSYVFRILSGLFLVSLSFPAFSQALPVGEPILEDYYRRAQLTGEMDSSVSFTIRPLYPSAAFKMADVFTPGEPASLRSEGTGLKKLQFKLLPVSLHQLYNSKVPTGYNDDVFIPAKGIQVKASAGFYAQYGPLTLQVQPVVIASPNTGYEGFPDSYPDFAWARYAEFYQGIIDKPERFGEKSYTKVRPGQSSVRLNIDPVSIGISTENLWWGPGQYNSLLMSNSAEGFYHLTFNTSRPVRTPAGSFEMQAIAGRLEDSGFDPPGYDRQHNGLPIYTPGNPEWRYLSGVVATWQPKWVSGLFIGYARTLQAYHRDLSGIQQVPLLLPFTKFLANDDTTLEKFDQYYSAFARWLFPAANGEVYVEYGRNNHAYSFENYPDRSSHSRAYTFGLKKLLPLRNGTDQIQVNLELTELNSPSDYLSKPGESWYVNKYVKQGYTNKGKLIGAGVGPGGSIQTLDISWFRRMNRVGLQVARYQHNNDLYYYFFAKVQEVRRHWVDLSETLFFNREFGKVLVNAQISAVKLMDYQYNFPPENYTIPFSKGYDVVNLQAQLGITYRF